MAIVEAFPFIKGTSTSDDDSSSMREKNGNEGISTPHILLFAQIYRQS